MHDKMVVTDLSGSSAFATLSSGGFDVFITSFCGSLSRYHFQMASIVSWIVVILMNRILNERSVGWFSVKSRNNQKSQKCLKIKMEEQSFQ